MIALIFMSYVIVWSLINKKSMPKSSENSSFLEKVKKFTPEDYAAVYDCVTVANEHKGNCVSNCFFFFHFFFHYSEFSP